MEGEKERQGDYIFTAAHVGEYSFCFNNDMSSFSEKFVDFDIMVENEPRPVAPAKPTSIAEQTSSLEDSIYKLSGSLSNIQRTQKYFRFIIFLFYFSFLLQKKQTRNKKQLEQDHWSTSSSTELEKIVTRQQWETPRVES